MFVTIVTEPGLKSMDINTINTKDLDKKMQEEWEAMTPQERRVSLVRWREATRKIADTIDKKIIEEYLNED
jgi:hypothetical protein